MILSFLVKILVYPGILFLFAWSFAFEWIYRKFLARLQNRFGPQYTGPLGILQPIADFLKLLSKEDLTPQASDKLVFALSPIFFLALPLTAFFVVPIASETSIVNFEGDLFFVLFIFTLIVVTVFLAGWCSTSRFSEIGGVRGALQMLGYEIPMGLSVIGPAMLTRSLSISNIVGWQAQNLWIVWLQPIGFSTLIVCLLAELQLIPFDVAEAKTEIVAGWQTEFSGKKLALIKLGKNVELTLASALVAALYLGGPQEIWLIPPVIGFLVKTTAVLMIFATLRGAFARFRIDQVLRGSWKYLVPITILQIILIQYQLR